MPYNVGQTARTTPRGAVVPSATFQYASADRLRERDGPAVLLGNGARLGLDERSDVGLQIVGPGAVVTYARRLRGTPGLDAGTTLVAGGGILLGGGGNAHGEVSVVTSPGPLGGDFDDLVPYGGLRAQALGPFGNDSEPAFALGAFGGVRFGEPDLAIAPEIGVFYSPSPLFGESDWIVAPSVTVRGAGLLRALGL